jgi:hypothetical protein
LGGEKPNTDVPKHLIARRKTRDETREEITAAKAACKALSDELDATKVALAEAEHGASEYATKSPNWYLPGVGSHELRRRDVVIDNPKGRASEPGPKVYRANRLSERRFEPAPVIVKHASEFAVELANAPRRDSLRGREDTSILLRSK